MGHRIADFEFRVKDIIERVNIVEVRAFVATGLFHDPLINHVVNNVAKTTCRIDVPVLEYNSGHVAVLMKGIAADRFAELLASQMSLTGLINFGVIKVRIKMILRAQLHRIGGISQCFSDKLVGFDRITRILADQLI